MATTTKETVCRVLDAKGRELDTIAVPVLSVSAEDIARLAARALDEREGVELEDLHNSTRWIAVPMGDDEWRRFRVTCEVAPRYHAHRLKGV